MFPYRVFSEDPVTVVHSEGRFQTSMRRTCYTTCEPGCEDTCRRSRRCEPPSRCVLSGSVKCQHADQKRRQLVCVTCLEPDCVFSKGTDETRQTHGPGLSVPKYSYEVGSHGILDKSWRHGTGTGGGRGLESDVVGERRGGTNRGKRTRSVVAGSENRT